MAATSGEGSCPKKVHKMSPNMHTHSVLCVFLCLCLVGEVESDGCTAGSYDLSPIGGNYEWSAVSSDKNVTYRIRICQALQISDTPSTDCPTNTTVCKLETAKSPISVGNFTTANYKDVNSGFTVDKTKGEFWLTLRGARCPGQTSSNYRTVINFKCGTTLGSPEFLDAYVCETYFEWRSYIACTDVAKPVKEVPCSAHKDGKKYDLSALIKLSGAYSVESTGDRDVFINVCRDIKGHNRTVNCPGGAGACRISGSDVTDIGHPSRPLEVSADGSQLTLTYTSDTKPSFCLSNPTTKINFICPKRGASGSPMLISDEDCHYVIQWSTEHACPLSYVTSKTCKFTVEQHDIDIDLTPLTNPPGTANPYKTEYQQANGDKYAYFINVCGDLNIPCPELTEGISACQVKPSESDFGKSIGRKDTQTLRYADGELTLTMTGGDPCHTHFPRTTVISFHCNQTAGNGGRGSPVFNKDSSNCTYMFDWDTKYACLDHPDATCQVEFGKLRFDLAPLVKNSGNWIVTDADGGDSNTYYLNICHDVLPMAGASSCPGDSSACLKGPKGSTSLGKFTASPTYNAVTKTVQIQYLDGAPCGDDMKTKAIISLICRPGDLEGGPVLVRKSDNLCTYEFEWRTAAACVLARKTGTDCQVFDDEAGFMFNLAKLRKMSGSYNVSYGGYDYYLNVCGPVRGTACDAGGSHNDVGACQVKPSNGEKFITGLASSMLSYYDGMINLTYTGGDLYHNSYMRSTEIAFLCDTTAGDGHPRFVQETDHTYSFEWYTKYACPERVIECVVNDEVRHQQYDLSSLSNGLGTLNWVATHREQGGLLHKYYINVCRPVNPVIVDGDSCLHYAAACETQANAGTETIVHHSLGHTLSGPRVEGEGHLTLEYTSGDPCTSMAGDNTTYKTLIHFRCKKGSLSTAPTFTALIENCQYMFEWYTEAACPIFHGTNTGDSCSVKDINSEYVFNLAPLKKKGSDVYNVTGGGRTFKLNICGSVPERVCDKVDQDHPVSVCEIKSDNTKPGLGETISTLEYSEEGDLTLTYEGHRNHTTGKRTTVLVRFICNRDKDPGQPVFLSQMDGLYRFAFETALACPPQPVDCAVQDRWGNEYDLSPLARSDINWNVIDSRVGRTDLRYYINVCRPINPISGSTCHEGPIGGCQVADKGVSFSLGYVQGKPQVVKPGTLSLHYRNGSPCHMGKANQARRSMTINFICTAVHYDPVFELETDTCEYVFTWRTPTACPQTAVTGADCQVTDPLYSYHFSMTSLRKATGDYHVSGGGYVFLLNICGNLNEGTGVCAGSSGVGACQTGNGNPPVNAGNSNSNLIYDNGVMTLKYTDGKANCHKKYNRTTIITFLCDQSKTGADGPEYMNETADCTYLFDWWTSLACPPYKVTDCSIHDEEGKLYDFSSLARTDHNYEVETQTPSWRKYIINVCRSLVHQKGETCPFNAGSCMINMTAIDAKHRYSNLGELGEHVMIVSDGHVKLNYTHGDPCTLVPGRRKTTFIHFECRQDVIGSNPQQVTEFNECEYNVHWFTRAACPVESPFSTGDNCTATNPSTGYKFDLSVLKKSTPYRFDDLSAHEFNLSICSPLTDHACGAQSGSCQKEKSPGSSKRFNSGNANGNLHFADGVLYLTYSNGDRCHHNSFNRTTIVSFVCNEDAGNGQPVFVSETDCIYNMAWHTALACEDKMECSVQTGNRTIDLSPLIKPSSHYVAIPAGESDPGATYYINICRPLNPIKATLCPPGSGACRAKPGQDTQSLGRIYGSGRPFIDQNNGLVTIEYVHGDFCPRNTDLNITSRIIFSCVRGPSQGEPRLVDITQDCVYVFEWKTNVVCSSTAYQFTGNCTFYDDLTKTTFDLSPLRDVGTVPLTSISWGSYNVSVCKAVSGGKTECKTAGVCHINNQGAETSFGEVSQATFQRNGEILELSYKGGKSCNGKSSSIIYFECDPSVEIGKPTETERSSCEVTFVWKTSVVCPPVRGCTLVHRGNMYDLRLLSQDTGSWNLTDSQGSMYWINVCQGIHHGPQTASCPSHAAACKKNKDGTVTMLGSVLTQSMSVDKDYRVILKYTQGSTCQHSARRSNNPDSTTVIRFSCGHTVGGPVYIPDKENEANCVFTFEWKSSIACKEERTQVDEVNGKLTDPRAGGVFDLEELNKLNNGENHFVTVSNGHDRFTYVMSLEGKLNVEKRNVKSKVCQNAAVCQEKPADPSFYKNLGSFSSKKFYIEDDILQVEFDTDSECAHHHDVKVRSIITFICSSEAKAERSQPRFLYRSTACTYLFDWPTSLACVKPNVQHITPIPSVDTGVEDSTSGKHTSSSQKATTMAIVISSLAAVLLVVIAVLVLSNKDRRQHLMYRVKDVFGRSKTTPMQYSLLSQNDDDALLEDTEINQEDSSQPYHDDSDDDLLA